MTIALEDWLVLGGTLAFIIIYGMFAAGKKVMTADEFLKEKQMSQTELINNYIPAVLIAIDEKLYWELYKQIYDNENVKQEVEKIRGGKMGEG